MGLSQSEFRAETIRSHLTFPSFYVQRNSDILSDILLSWKRRKNQVKTSFQTRLKDAASTSAFINLTTDGKMTLRTHCKDGKRVLTLMIIISHVSKSHSTPFIIDEPHRRLFELTSEGSFAQFYLINIFQFGHLIQFKTPWPFFTCPY